MTVDVWPITDNFAAEIGDVDLSQPLEDEDWRQIEDAYNRHSVLVFPDQHLENDQLSAFANRFGSIDHSMQKSLEIEDERLPDTLADVSNLDRNGNVLSDNDRMMGFQRGNRLWHTDSSFKTVPANASCLYMRSTPPVGGHTEFADMQAAWDALDPELQHKIEGRIAIHSIATSRARMGFEMTADENANYPRVAQAMVRTHPANGRKSIYVASHVGSIVDMADSEATALLDQLVAHATQRQFVYQHRWHDNDVVVWDNKCTLHRGRPFDDLRWPRDARRGTSLDVASTLVQENLELPASVILG
ncbi:MAG: alpha-ketoglutarate-dependent 2,4-dichlorophenoxyacetate dioxygenase [Acidimicrobiales bacterium]|jgi:alpha-ketoglutarate-dependent 2,4-dichlorophenoxyacetate dioxygenase